MVLLPFYMFSEWHDSLNAAGYEIMSHPFMIGLYASTVDNRNQSNFLQNGYEFTLIARLPPSCCSINLKLFKPDFIGSLQSVQVKTSRHLSAMFLIPLPTSRLFKINSTMPLHVTDKLTSMLAERVCLFTP